MRKCAVVSVYWDQSVLSANRSGIILPPLWEGLPLRCTSARSSVGSRTQMLIATSQTGQMQKKKKMVWIIFRQHAVGVKWANGWVARHYKLRAHGASSCALSSEGECVWWQLSAYTHWHAPLLSPRCSFRTRMNTHIESRLTLHCQDDARHFKETSELGVEIFNNFATYFFLWRCLISNRGWLIGEEICLSRCYQFFF